MFHFKLYMQLNISKTINFSEKVKHIYKYNTIKNKILCVYVCVCMSMHVYM